MLVFIPFEELSRKRKANYTRFLLLPEACILDQAAIANILSMRNKVRPSHLT